MAASKFMEWEDSLGTHFRCRPVLKAFQIAAFPSKFSGQGQFNILRRARGSQPEFEGAASLLQPRGLSGSENISDLQALFAATSQGLMRIWKPSSRLPAPCENDALNKKLGLQ